jgi:prepilin-type N-terminal cleavage/methylation domain-containing protein
MYRHNIRRPAAFTLVELLVVIGIIALLLGILLPTLVNARRAATDAECKTRLRELTHAATLYHLDHKQYPLPDHLPAFAAPVPLAINDNLANALGPYLGWPSLSYSQTVPELPKLLACPERMDVDLLKEPYPAAQFGAQFWNTGYSYIGPALDTGSAQAVALSADNRITNRRGTRRGVLWADNLILVHSGGATNGYAYFHFKGGHDIDPTFLTVVQPKSLRGHHRAWTDGSVEWLPRGTFDLTPANADSQAAYRAGNPAVISVHFYF